MNITLLAVRNPKWVTIKNIRHDAEGSIVKDAEGNTILDTQLDNDGNPVKVIDCETKWSHLGDSSQDWEIFTAHHSDSEQHGRDLYDALINGEHGAIADE